MHIFEIISEQAVYNIIGHIKNCWNYTYPTGKALEEAIYRGLIPFYKNVQTLGGPHTIVDVLKDTDAFDIKGAKQLGFLKKIGTTSNQAENNFVEQTFPNGKKITVKIPRDILAIVKRPNADMEKFEGAPIDVLKKSIGEYETFARTTTAKAKCKNLYSIVVLYEEDKINGLRSIFFTLEEFSVPNIIQGRHISKKTGENAGYIGTDETNTTCYKLLGFNPASVNSYKKFVSNRGILYTWLINEDDSLTFDELNLEQNGFMHKIV